MKKIFICLTLSIVLHSANYGISAQKTIDTPTFGIENGQFSLNGEPYIIKAAELHYPRIPREYWDHRIKMTKALGMNTICLYVFWNIHEQREGEFDFTEGNNLREFIKLCDENGMKVILRPGPYVCAEWEMGGLPWWLLKKKDIRLRERDPYFMERVEAFQEAVANEVADLTIDKGGPILMVQVENEYGAYGEDKEYIAAIRDILRKHYGDDVLMFQCDWSSNFQLNGLDDLLWTMNFGTGADIDSQFAELKRLRPESPLMCSEYWSGWFDKWGAAHETRPADAMIAGIDEMLSKDISFSLYMTHGGTNWSHWAGANSPGYSPDVTSYDYDAPISENGAPTEKYYLLRDVLKKYSEEDSLSKIPETIETLEIPAFRIDSVAELWKNLPNPVFSEGTKTFEECDMGFGSMLYETELPPVSRGARLTITEPHDFAQVYVNETLIGTLDRRKGEKTISLPAINQPSKLKILIEATGRINFGRAIKDFKGITEKVTLTDKDGKETELKGWNIYLLPDELESYQTMVFEKMNKNPFGQRLPQGVYKGKFMVEKPSDTFLNFETWGKGLVYVNGHGIGRIWEIGPQQTLYVPGPWLKEGENEILIFDIVGPSVNVVEGLENPIINKVKLDQTSNTDLLSENLLDPVITSTLAPGNGWKQVSLEQPIRGQLVALELTDGYSNSGSIAIAEVYLLDKDGNRIDREHWKVVADSEQLEGNHTADKTIDLQESTYWLSEASKDFPHLLLISLEKPYEIGGVEILPRMETGAPDALKTFNLYIK